MLEIHHDELDKSNELYKVIEAEDVWFGIYVHMIKAFI